LTIDAALIRRVSVQVRDLSTGGCLLETRVYLPVGTVGVLEMEIEGKRCVEWFRIRRTQDTQGRSGAYLFGAEFLLPVAVAGETSLRGAVSRAFRIDRVSGRTGRMSGKPGNSIVFGTASARAIDAHSAQTPRQVINFRRSDGAVESGSPLAESAAGDEPNSGQSDDAGEVDMKNVIVRFVRDDQGQDLIEYVLIGSFVSIGALAGATLLGTNLNGWYNAIAGWVAGASALVP
jgi:Flp pilus assembly pilin Flp